MIKKLSNKILLILLALLTIPPAISGAQVELLELYCPSCGFRERFMQGADPVEQRRNVQHIIVVCERTRQIRNIKIPVNPGAPVYGEPLLARQYGTGRSELLGERLPRFLVPGNTCPLFPLAAYLERNICPVDGSIGIQIALIGGDQE
jgi:hypothetical protein